MLYKVTEIYEAWDFEKRCAVQWDENSYCMNEEDLISHAEYCFHNSDVEDDIDLSILENAISFLKRGYRVEKAPDAVFLLVGRLDDTTYRKEFKGVRFEDVGIGVIEMLSGGKMVQFKVNLNSGVIVK
jgi:hypothetical protein